MELGVGLYRHMLKPDYYAFARQVGCTCIVAHLVDYFHNVASADLSFQPVTAPESPWGEAGHSDDYWTVDYLTALRLEVESFGLRLAAIENFDPGHWFDVLLDGPQRAEQMEYLKAIVRNVGEAGIPCIGYNFSLAGVCGRVMGPYARGGAITVGVTGPLDTPMPAGTVWGMTYDKSPSASIAPNASHEQLWNRLDRFLEELCPVAEASGVILAAHPDDPPLSTMRGQARLVYQPSMYQRLIDACSSTSNALEVCIGSLGEMTDGDMYEQLESYARQGKIAYVHLRNVVGKVPHYVESFIDDGDIDIERVLTILDRYGFDGVIIPDHVPKMNCEAPWHAGMAHTLGYIAGVCSTFRVKQSRSLWQ